MPRFMLTALIAVALSLGGPLAPAAQAATMTCTGELTGITINGDLVVPSGQTCTLRQVTVTGKVTVESGASLKLFNSTTNVKLTATNADTVEAVPPTAAS